MYKNFSVLGCYLMMRCFAHNQVKCAGLDLSEAPIAIERYRDRDGRIVTLKLHSARNQQIVKLVYMQRFARLTKQKSAGLSDSAVRKAMADRFNVCCDGRNPVLVNVSNRITAPVPTRDRVAARCGTKRPSHLLPCLVIVLDPGRFAQTQDPVARTHRNQQTVDSGFGLSRAVLKRFDLLLQMFRLVLNLAQPRHQTVLSVPRLTQTLFKCCYKVFV